MSWISRLISPNDKGPEKDKAGLERQLKELEEQAEKAPLASRGPLLNRAGDMCLKAGDRLRALRYFGEAIDTLLSDEQPEPARGVAKKIIRIHPEAIRTLCTLTWLDLAARQTAASILDLRLYVEAARRGGQEALTSAQILDMVRYSDQVDFLKEAAEALEELGASQEATQVRGWVSLGGAPDAPEDPQELSAICFKAAMGSNARRRAEGALA
jgi:hypothetical protein